MGRQLRSERALQWSALSFLRGAVFLGALLSAGTSSAAAGHCRADHYDEEVVVAYVYDGDTIKLADGRKVRLAGINAPEVSHYGKPAQPLGDKSRAFLSRQLEGESHLYLRYDEQRKDRYGRLLAHLYLLNGTDLQERLLDAGLALQMVVPPNDWQSDCYQAVERAARSRRVGLWGDSYYHPLATAPDAESNGSFRLIGGVVARVAESRKSVWLNLDNGFAIRIARSDLPRFGALDLHRLEGRSVVARGYLHLAEGHYQVTVREPLALTQAREW